MKANNKAKQSKAKQSKVKLGEGCSLYAHQIFKPFSHWQIFIFPFVVLF